MRKIVLATRNKGKVAEIKELLTGLVVEVFGVDSFPGVPEVEETGTTFLENALLKAKTVAQATGELAIADDSGLVVDALGGAPGVYSARYGEAGFNDQQRYEYLLQKMVGIPEKERTARFYSAMVIYDPVTNWSQTGIGTVEGVISFEPRGTNGFGYDPVFYLPTENCTMAELAENKKNNLSHRGRAFQKLLPELKKYLG